MNGDDRDDHSSSSFFFFFFFCYFNDPERCKDTSDIWDHHVSQAYRYHIHDSLLFSSWLFTHRTADRVRAFDKGGPGHEFELLVSQIADGML